MMEFLKGPIETVFSPVGIAVILTGAGIILSFTRRWRRAGTRVLISGALLFLILLLTPISQYLMLGLEKHYQPLLRPPKSAGIDTIVVLAGYAEENRSFPITTVLSERTICSMAEGLRLYRITPGAKLILSGGVVHEGDRPVAASMSDFAQQMGVSPEDIVVEGKSRTTYENLVEVQKIIAAKQFILVAQACDLMRAMAVARKLGMNPIAAPACYRALPHHTDGEGRFFEAILHPSTENLFMIQWAWHEYLGYVWYRLLGRV